MTDRSIIADETLATVHVSSSRPSEDADRLAADYSASTSDIARRVFGQFFTPLSVARFMARLATSSIRQTTVRILEPGAGTGVLSAAVCEELPSSVKAVHIDAYEIDDYLAGL